MQSDQTQSKLFSKINEVMALFPSSINGQQGEKMERHLSFVSSIFSKAQLPVDIKICRVHAYRPQKKDQNYRVNSYATYIYGFVVTHLEKAPPIILGPKGEEGWQEICHTAFAEQGKDTLQLFEEVGVSFGGLFLQDYSKLWTSLTKSQKEQFTAWEALADRWILNEQASKVEKIRYQPRL